MAAPDANLPGVPDELLQHLAGETHGGQITLTAECAAQAVRLSVQDDGAGISPENLPYVFDNIHFNEG